MKRTRGMLLAGLMILAGGSCLTPARADGEPTPASPAPRESGEQKAGEAEKPGELRPRGGDNPERRGRPGDRPGFGRRGPGGPEGEGFGRRGPGDGSRFGGPGIQGRSFRPGMGGPGGGMGPRFGQGFGPGMRGFGPGMGMRGFGGGGFGRGQSRGFRGPGGPGMAPGQVFPPRLRDELGLTEQQRKRLDDLQKDVDSRLKKVLTPEQAERLEGLRRRGPGGAGGPRGMGPQGPGERPRFGGPRGEEGSRRGPGFLRPPGGEGNPEGRPARPRRPGGETQPGATPPAEG